MFTKIKIENFKVFKLIEISDFSRINVFFGKNNCGKSTLLDALFILTGISNPQLIMRTNQFRDYTKLKDLSYFFHNFDTENNITLSSDGNEDEFERKASIKLSVSDKVEISSIQQMKELSSENKPIYNLSVNARVKNATLHPNLVVQFLENEEKGYFVTPANYIEKITCNYFSPSYSFAIIYEMVKKIVAQKEEQIIVDALKKLDQRITDFSLIGADVLVDVG